MGNAQVNGLGFEVGIPSVQALAPQTASGVTPLVSSAIAFDGSVPARNRARILIVGNAVCGALPTVTFTDSGDLVNSASHGLSDGDTVVFTTITTTTGISTGTVYYVVNKNANDFQVALTEGGDPIALTTNGSGAGHKYGTVGAFSVTESASSGGMYAAASTSKDADPQAGLLAASGGISLLSVKRNRLKPFIKVTWTSEGGAGNAIASATCLFIGDGV